MKASEKYFPLVLFIMLHKAVLTFEPVDGIHSNECCNAKYCGAVCFLIFCKKKF